VSYQIPEADSSCAVVLEHTRVTCCVDFSTVLTSGWSINDRASGLAFFFYVCVFSDCSAPSSIWPASAVTSYPFPFTLQVRVSLCGQCILEPCKNLFPHDSNVKRLLLLAWRQLDVANVWVGHGSEQVQQGE
jgi:hypothetical protein